MDTLKPRAGKPRMLGHGSIRGVAVAVSREQKMVEIMQELRAECPGVEAAVLVSSDAMPLASDMPESMKEEMLSALSSSLMASSERVARDLARGKVEQVYLRGDLGDLLVVSVNNDALLACTVDHQAKMGMMLLEVNRCASALAEVI